MGIMLSCQLQARTKEMSLQTLELGLVFIDTEGKTCVMDALEGLSLSP